MKVFISKTFKRDMGKVSPEILIGVEMTEVFYCLHRQLLLPKIYRDHALSGDWQGYRDCHVKNDLVLIYRFANEELQLLRLNSHSEIFG